MDPSQQEKFAIHAAARDGQTATVEAFLQASPKLAVLKDDDGRLPVHWAIAYNHRPIIDILTSRKDFDPDVQDSSGWTPLMIASSLREEDEELVNLLSGKGAEVTTQNHSGQTALHLTTSKSHLGIAKKLISQGASTRTRDRRGQLPLHRAAAIGSVPLVELILKNGSPLNSSDMAGQTALHHAISEGHGEAAIVLLRAGVETDKRDAEGVLAIDSAPDNQVRKYILQAAEREDIEVATS